MPKRGAIALTLTALALVLLINFQPPAEVASTTATTGARSSTTTDGATDAPAASAGTTADTTVDGPVVDTRFGPVQVEVTISGGRIAEVTALELPSGGRSGRISSYAEPLLQSEALQAQSASIDGVSGATYTSEAYAQSLQAALDQAGYAG
jgi:uncharacterized protein with FMN-binding domain